MCCSGALMIFHSYCCVPTGTLKTKHQLMRTASCFPSVVLRSCFKVSGCCFGFPTQNHIQPVLHGLHLFFNKFPGSSPWPCRRSRWWRDIKNDTFRQMLKVWKFKFSECKWHRTLTEWLKSTVTHWPDMKQSCYELKRQTSAQMSQTCGCSQRGHGG